MSHPPAICAKNLGKRYWTGGPQEPYGSLRASLAAWARRPFGRSSRREFWALRDVSFELPVGEVLGVVGRNGAGKSTLLKLLSRVTEPTEGTATLTGRVGSLLEVGTGFHPELSGRENIYLNGAILGMSQSDVARRFNEIVDFSEVGSFIDTPVKYYSSGMYVRLAFSVAAHMEPDILVVDEVLAVGDAAFQRRCLGKLEEARNRQRTVLLVSHDLGAILRLADSAVLLEGGRLIRQGPATDVVRDYLARSFPADPHVTYPDDPSRAAQISSISISDGRSGPSSALPPDASLHIAIEITVRSKTNCQVDCMIETSERVLLVDATTALNSRLPDAWSPGRHRVLFQFPPALLNAGRYLVRAGLGRPDGTVLDAHVSDGLSFEIVGRSEDGPGRRGLLGVIPETSVITDAPGGVS